MKARMLSLFVAALPLLPAGDLSGQQGGQNYVGSRVRLSVRTASREPWRIGGTLEAVSRDSLRLQTSKYGSMSLSISSIEKLQVSRGRKRNLKQGLLIGGVAGGAVGAALGAALAEECSPDDSLCFGRGFSAFGGAGVGMVGGGAVGGVLGLLTKSDRWRAVPLTGLRMAVGPQRGGAGFTVAASINF